MGMGRKGVLLMRCPYCQGDAYKMGALGNYVWYRCRNCGIEFHRKSRKKKGAKNGNNGAARVQIK